MTAAVAACARDGDDELTVISEVLSDPTAPDLIALAPEDEGPWPVVVALHGIDGTGEDMVALETRLAETGVVVFAPTYSTDLTTPEGLIQATDDILCAYQVVRRVAPDYGGGLTKPVTAIGWSLGADFVVLGGLGPATDNAAGRCPGEVPSPNVVVGLSGCPRRSA